jgi:NADH dehydrogenase
MTKLVTIFGGSGFIGRYVVRRMARRGWRVRVAVRRPNEALFVRTYGVVGQVEPVFCNIRDDSSVAEVLGGAEAVVNCVGVLNEVGKNTFQNVQSEGAERIARLSAEASALSCSFRPSVPTRRATARTPAQRRRAKRPCCATSRRP